jgi:hypothetical protein
MRSISTHPFTRNCPKTGQNRRNRVR